jgi:hypothetical protein
MYSDLPVGLNLIKFLSPFPFYFVRDTPFALLCIVDTNVMQ